MKEQSTLSKEIKTAKSKVTIGAKYSHYKNEDKVYEVTGLGFLEESDELCVIYKAQYGHEIIFIRLLSVWLDEVEWKGEVVPRFKSI